MDNIIQMAVKIVVGMMGFIAALLEPTIPFIAVCTFAIFCDCFSAWSLSRRVKKKYPKNADGKFKSVHFGKVIMTILKVYAVIILSFLVERYILEGRTIELPNCIAGAVCFWQFWSILENESSCNDARWAKIAQRILVDKTERHFDVDLHELKEDDKEGVDDGKS